MREVHALGRSRLAASRRVILYGASLAALGVLREYGLPVAYLVDDTPGAAGRRLPSGLEVRGSDSIRGERAGDFFVVVCAWTQNGILGISRRLRTMGLQDGRDFIDCSFLHFESLARKLQVRFGAPQDVESFLECRLWFLNCADSSISSIAGTWLFTQLLRRLGAAVPGDVAECGVYRGGNAFLGLMLSPVLRERTYRLLDSFEGFPHLSDADPKSHQDQFRDTDLAAVRGRFADWPHVEIHPGYFAASLPNLPDARYALVYVDCDLYEGTRTCLEYFYPRLSPGGVLLVHDLWLPAPADSAALGLDLYSGVKKACDEYFGPEAQRIECKRPTDPIWRRRVAA